MDRLWKWYTKGLLGVVGLIQDLSKASVAPAQAVKELTEARQLMDHLLADQARKQGAVNDGQ